MGLAWFQASFKAAGASLASPAGITQINDSQLLTSAGDGRLMVWDLRNAAAGPIKFAVPDGRCGALPCPWLLSTAHGLCCLRHSTQEHPSRAPTAPAPAPRRPILRMALSPFADAAAVATPGGLYAVDLLDSACHASPIAAGPPASPVTALLWNAATSEVVAAGGPGAAGSISVFKQRLGGY